MNRYICAMSMIPPYVAPVYSNTFKNNENVYWPNIAKLLLIFWFSSLPRFSRDILQKFSFKCCCYQPVLRMRDPALFWPLDPDPILLCRSGSGVLSTLDPGWKKSDLGSGINIPDPQFCSQINLMAFDPHRIFRKCFTCPPRYYKLQLEIYGPSLTWIWRRVWRWWCCPAAATPAADLRLFNPKAYTYYLFCGSGCSLINNFVRKVEPALKSEFLIHTFKKFRIRNISFRNLLLASRLRIWIFFIVSKYDKFKSQAFKFFPKHLQQIYSR